MKSYFVYLYALICFLLPVCGGAGTPGPPTQTLSACLANGDTVRVVIHETQLDPQYPYRNAFVWGGDFEPDLDSIAVVPPLRVISSVTIHVGTEQLFLPLSAFCDLGDPNDFSLTVADSGFSITITGGQTSSHYKAVLTFDTEMIISREISLFAFPEEVWEKTTFSFIRREDRR
jgi:hypothetical protein